LVSGEIELDADLNTEDDEGLNWTVLSAAAHPEVIRPGAVVTAGRDRYWSWVRVIRVDPDGQVHFQQLSAAEARHTQNLADAH
jgi:hypothetical protein